MRAEGGEVGLETQVQEDMMLKRLKFWFMRNKHCRGCCMTCKHYAECRREILGEL